jgi:putative endonuclease
MAKLGHTRALGEQLETVALRYLEANGLTLICRNFQCKLGEIDLVMLEAQMLVFIEVRYRRSERFGSAAETVDLRKQRKLLRTAALYLNMHRQSHRTPCRFDVLGITLTGPTREYCFDWIPNAFGCESA